MWCKVRCFTALARIDPNASTEFAGATGVFYISGKTVDGGATFPQGEITGSMCFAN